MAFLGSGAGGAALGLGGGLLGRAGSSLLDVLNQPQQAVNSAAMALGGPRQATYGPASQRQSAQALAGMMAMQGGPGDLGLGRAASAAAMMGGVEGMPYTLGSDLDSMRGPPADARQGSFIPALLGALAGGASVFTPLSPLAVPIGAGAAGLAQLLMNKQDPDQYGSFSTSEVLDRMGLDPNAGYRSALDPLVGFATDPMTWAGAAGGVKANAALTPLSSDARLSALAEQAAASKAMSGEFNGIGRTVGLGEASPIPLLQNDLPFPPSQMGAMMPNELTSLLDAMEGRITARNAAWAQAAQASPRVTAGPPAGLTAGPASEGSLPFSPLMAPTPRAISAEAAGMQPTNFAMPALGPPNGGGLSFSMTPGEVNALAPGEIFKTGTAPTSVHIPAAAAGTPMGLPAPLNQGLTQGYGPQALANLPQMPLGSPAYKLLRPEVQDLLRQLGIPPEMLAKGGLPPWAQVSGGRVGMSPGLLPQDVVRGALGAGGY